MGEGARASGPVGGAGRVGTGGPAAGDGGSAEQRPDATAVLEIEQWNKIFGRWVNRGARGIAVFADENRSRQRLTHYFDISDTHESRYSRTVPIWNMRQEYEADVIETLESTFGEIENKSSLAEAIIGAARNAADPALTKVALP